MLLDYLEDDFKVEIKKEEALSGGEDLIADPVDDFEKILINKGFLPLCRGECYSRKITKNSDIYIQRIDADSSVWTGYRLTYDEYNAIRREKVITRDTNFIRVVGKVEKYVESYLQYLTEIN